MKPILCNTQVVQNIQAGRQTQDRRPVKFKKGMAQFVDGDDPWQWVEYNSTGPKYQPGDILYVRETFCETTFIECARTNEWDYEIMPGQRDDNGVLGNYAKCILYKTFELSCPVGKWKPSIHMPKKFARIFLKVTKVRVEKFCDITDADALAEGMEEIGERKFHGNIWKPIFKSYDPEITCCSAVAAFETLINSLYPDQWEDWCFVYDFEKCDKP
jgi:hypothetical protein